MGEKDALPDEKGEERLAERREPDVSCSRTEKSGVKRYRIPSVNPGSDTLNTAMTTRMTTQTGISTTEIRSIPARTPAETMIPVARTARAVKMTGWNEPVKSEKLIVSPAAEKTAYASVQPVMTR